ncbi:hypothetical protein [Pseudoalteromonas luteoviolacea]|uniref:Uncharacterized protein n=1 Tax=Pseudoalteromonas luteoviolacea S4054 TaxID=1129367 RepID=A0A0F6AH47_9GAMM|nr:hypothetical protein [Pseudoalteromonas luteoviolacea]AOT06458.1 hypothetical protein S4054249_00485 [Pseudoalteromonas luteoviolacea]AOT11375.1 hypothetical protein S40542_00485 [Pseudoalteromonas luteoviolacea]AOT16288.1 hypothetical protein S4054_00485 [Pseudoalteromonas luteoviolacea]KKE85532.1 hypothetical protein N479_04335 [Pseudoalteromonas luteoviolacea S4054]KZN73062.1 hypothetical protein N481_13495 [Pseudoalteromonas luteoviolacea S4047-1]
MNKWLTLLALSISLSAHAQDTALAQLTACQDISVDQKRLQCYDQALAQYQAKQPDAQKHPIAALPTANVALSAEQQQARFGIENKTIQNEQRVDNMEATIIKLTKSAHGVRTFELSNTQVWKQIGSGAFFAKQDDTVTIKRGSFNSFLMSKSGSNRTIRVKRIK